MEAVCLESVDEAYERFVKGEVDVMPIPLKGAEKYNAGIQKKVMTGICESLYLDLQTEGPLQCREFRQALNYALNRVEYTENMDSDFLVPNARYVPENGLGILKLTQRIIRICRVQNTEVRSLQKKSLEKHSKNCIFPERKM